MMWFAYTTVNIPDSARMGIISASSAARTSLSTDRFVCAFGSGLAINAPRLPLCDPCGGGDPAAGAKSTMLLVPVISVGLLRSTFALTGERGQPAPNPAASLGKDLKDLFSHGPWLVLFFAAFFPSPTSASATPHHLLVQLHRGPRIQVHPLRPPGTVAFILGAMAPPVSARFQPSRPHDRPTLVNAAATAAFFCVEPHSLPTLHLLNILGAFAAGPTPAIVWSLSADTADDGAWKFGCPTTGLVFSSAVFAQKIALAVGSFMPGWILTFVGFVPSAVPTRNPSSASQACSASCPAPSPSSAVSPLSTPHLTTPP